MTFAFKYSWFRPGNTRQETVVFVIGAPDFAEARYAQQEYRLTMDDALSSRPIKPYEVQLEDLPTAMVLRYQGPTTLPRRVATGFVRHPEG